MKPELLVLLLTTRCNLACSYCYLSCIHIGEDMPLEVLYQALSRIKATPREIILSGGEPTLNPHLLLEAIKTIRERFPEARLSLQTNGTLLNERLIQVLKEYRVGLGLSLDGPPEVNEALRGETKRVLKAFKLLAEHDKACGVTITVTGFNAEYLGECILLLAQFAAVKSLGLDLLRPAGRGKGVPLPEEADLIRGLGELKLALNWLRLKGRRLILREVLRRKNPLGYCPAERGKALVITPFGDVYLCASLVEEKNFLMGNVFGEISPMALPRACGDCLYYENCPGRCPSRAILSQKAARLDCLIKKTFLEDNSGLREDCRALSWG